MMALTREASISHVGLGLPNKVVYIVQLSKSHPWIKLVNMVVHAQRMAECT